MRNFILLLMLCLHPLYVSAECLLEQSNIYIDYNNSSYSAIQDKTFLPIRSNHINYSFSDDIALWLKFSLSNDDNYTKERVIEVNNPLLEHVIFFDDKGVKYSRGMLHKYVGEKSINPSLYVSLSPHSRHNYFVKIQNSTTALQFSLRIVDKEQFLARDKNSQFSIILFIGIILAFLLYSLVLYIYSKDVSYFYYALYIAILLFQQLTYIGFLPLYMPLEFTKIDNLLVVPKVGMLIITAALFAQHFLKTSEYLLLHRIYNYIIYVVLVEIALFSTPYLYLPEITILTGLGFIFFNLYSAIYVYIKGNKQARFFIVGWSVLIVGYFLSIIDALGIYSIMYKFPHLILMATVVEALFLLLAFVDKLNILQEEKERADIALFDELHYRKKLVDKEVLSRTNALHLLYRELHHRVKNNLQIILSIIRLQGDKIVDTQSKEAFVQLEGRINSIAKTHEILYQNEEQEDIDMYEYILSLIEDIRAAQLNDSINIRLTCNITMALKEAVYVGLIINELVQNSFKYAKCSTINVMLTKLNNEYVLQVSDDGIGFNSEEIKGNGLGLKLVHTLIYNQLNGTLQRDMSRKNSYDIRFST